MKKTVILILLLSFISLGIYSVLAVERPNQGFVDIEPNDWTKMVSQDTSGNESTPRAASETQTFYELELDRWNISNDGTRPLETTLGINQALKWANENGITGMKVPAGTYLISKGDDDIPQSDAIYMVSDMHFLLDDEAILQKETNGLEGYAIIEVGGLVDNVVIEGGTVRGDRDTHDYSEKEGDWSAGTHEWGYCVAILGGRNITVKNMTLEKCTGDGLIVTGHTKGGTYIKEEDLEPGALDANGYPIDQSGKIRTGFRTFEDIQPDLHPRHRVVNIWLASGLTAKEFDVFYYDEHQNFILHEDGRVESKYSSAPEQAKYFRIVFHANRTTGVSMNHMLIENAKNITIENNDIGYNRRQGITAGGENVQIIGNYIHHTGGTAPQSGIDIEPGFFPARDIMIKQNEFYNNRIQVVLAYGDQAVIEENLFRGGPNTSVGVVVHAAYRGIEVKNNEFIDTGYQNRARNSLTEGNTFVDSTASITGESAVFRNNKLEDSGLSVGQADDIIISSSTIIQTENNTDTANLRVEGGGEHILIQDVHLRGLPDDPIEIAGYSSNTTVMDRLSAVNVTAGSTGLPSGTYQNSTFTFTGAEGLGSLSVQYNGDVTIDDVRFENYGIVLRSSDSASRAVIQNAAFAFDRHVDRNDPVIYAYSAGELSVIDSTFTADHQTTEDAYIMKLGQHSGGNIPERKVMKATLHGNEIRTNVPTWGIHSTEAGLDSGGHYTIEDNVLYGAKLDLKQEDMTRNNQELEEK